MVHYINASYTIMSFQICGNRYTYVIFLHLNSTSSLQLNELLTLKNFG